jgi:hypothetical protein
MRGDSWGPSGQSLQGKTKSSNEGQILEAIRGQKEREEGKKEGRKRIKKKEKEGK